MKKEDNCLNIFRLLSAFQVAFFHITYHLNILTPKYLNDVIAYFQGVPFFFMISGYLIYFSLERSKNYKEYIKKRFFRIYPELWLCIVLELISIICLYKITNIKYFIIFGITQATFFQFYTPQILRNYGCGTPNGSLWTICVLIQFYLIAYLLKKYLKNKNVIKHIIIIFFTLIFSTFGFYFKDIIPEIVIKLYSQSIFNYLYLFIIGMFIAKYNNKIIPVVKKYYLLFILISIISYIIKVDISNTSYGILIPTLYFISVLGFSYKFPKLNIKTDLSYGIYLYHMIIVNIFITYKLTKSIIYLIIVLVITVILAKTSQIISKKITSKIKKII